MSFALVPTPTAIFTEVEIMKVIRKAVDVAVLTVESTSFSEPSPSLILGKPGTGKTSALLQLKSENKRFIYVQASDADSKLKGLLKALLLALGVYHDRQHTSDLEELVVDHLESINHMTWERRADCIILIDEYQSYALQAIRELLRICESTHTPLILAGNEEKLKATQVEKTAVDQIKSRLGVIVHLPDHPTAKDCQCIGASYNVEGKDAYDWLVEHGENMTLRKLVKILNLCREFNDEGVGIRLHNLKEAKILFKLTV